MPEIRYYWADPENISRGRSAMASKQIVTVMAQRVLGCSLASAVLLALSSQPSVAQFAQAQGPGVWEFCYIDRVTGEMDNSGTTSGIHTIGPNFIISAFRARPGPGGLIDGGTEKVVGAFIANKTGLAERTRNGNTIQYWYPVCYKSDAYSVNQWVAGTLNSPNEDYQMIDPSELGF